MVLNLPERDLRSAIPVDAGRLRDNQVAQEHRLYCCSVSRAHFTKLFDYFHNSTMPVVKSEILVTHTLARSLCTAWCRSLSPHLRRRGLGLALDAARRDEPNVGAPADRSSHDDDRAGSDPVVGSAVWPPVSVFMARLGQFHGWP